MLLAASFFEQITGTSLVLLVAVIAFFMGLAVGAMSRGGAIKKWLGRHGCYLCREKYDYQCRAPEEWDE